MELNQIEERGEHLRERGGKVSLSQWFLFLLSLLGDTEDLYIHLMKLRSRNLRAYIQLWQLERGLTSTSLSPSPSTGTGKSVLLREIIASLRRKYSSSPDVVAVTASTGIAACNIGGVTLHSFSGIGLGLEDASLLIQKIRKNKKASGRWMRTKVLIIDESK